jgi:hypothetical protein
VYASLKFKMVINFAAEMSPNKAPTTCCELHSLHIHIRKTPETTRSYRLLCHLYECRRKDFWHKPRRHSSYQTILLTPGCMIVTAIRVQGQETLMKPRVVLQYNQCCFTKSIGIQVAFFNLIPPTSKSTICDYASAPYDNLGDGRQCNTLQQNKCGNSF